MQDVALNPQYKILIVDDNKDDHFFLNKAILNVMPSAVVKSLFDGSEAIEYLFKDNALPDLIFLDLHMDKLSGSYTMNLIKKNKKLSKIPVIILTSSTSLADRIDLKIKLRASDFFTKPITNEELVRIIEKVKEKWLA
jgi:CheY-like chemotaxis protein